MDTRGVCWLFGWGYFNNQSANKTRKKAENLKSLTITMSTWDNKPWRLVLRCWYLTLVHHEVVCRDDRGIFVTIIEGRLEFDLILLQLWNKVDCRGTLSSASAVVPPENGSQSARRINSESNYKDWAVFPFFKISFNNVFRYLLTVLSKQLLIQPLEYLTSELRAKAKSSCYVKDTSRPNIWGKRSVVMSVQLNVWFCKRFHRKCMGFVSWV